MRFCQELESESTSSTSRRGYKCEQVTMGHAAICELSVAYNIRPSLYSTGAGATTGGAKGVRGG